MLSIPDYLQKETSQIIKLVMSTGHHHITIPPYPCPLAPGHRSGWPTRQTLNESTSAPVHPRQK